MSIRVKQALRVVFALCFMCYWAWLESWTWFQFFIAVDVSIISSTLMSLEDSKSVAQK